MSIVGGFDVHRKQVTFDYLDVETGEVAIPCLPGVGRSCRRRQKDQFGPMNGDTLGNKGPMNADTAGNNGLMDAGKVG